MPEIIGDRKIFSLLDVTRSIQRTLAERYSTAFWVKAEMNKLNHYPHSGHCYPELVEKREGKVIAQLRATLWRDDYQRINRRFMSVLNAPLRDGVTILFCARIAYDPVHGLSLWITDIDPVFTLGELEREKAETIAALREEGIFTRNKALEFPLLPQRIAVISVETSKGYADFQKVIANNAEGYKFFYMLFPAVLQGERAVESIGYQLRRIRKVARHFDVVAIIRGGGGEVGLSCFNNIELCRAIANFPIPVITGIGHATNETVAEMVAFRNAITPTDLANFLIERFDDFAAPLSDAVTRLQAESLKLIQSSRLVFSNAVRFYRAVTLNALADDRHTVDKWVRALVQYARYALRGERDQQESLAFDLRRSSIAVLVGERRELDHKQQLLKKNNVIFTRQQFLAIDNLQTSVDNMSPQRVLKRGFSITRIDGKALKTVAGIQPGQRITTFLADGSLQSEVKSVNHESNE